MPTRDELAAEYDDACTELDRANLEALMVERRARLAGTPPDPEDLEAVQRRIRVATRQVKVTADAMKAAGWAPSRRAAFQSENPPFPQRGAA